MIIKIQAFSPGHLGITCIKCGNHIIMTDYATRLIQPGQHSCDYMIYKEHSCGHEYQIPIVLAEGAEVVTEEVNG